MAGTELGKAWVQIVPSAEGISGSIQKILDPEADSAGQAAGGKLVGSLKRVIAAAGIGAAFKKSIEAGANLEQSFGGLETIYGNAAEKAKEYAAAAVQAGISTNSYAEQAVSFGASLKQAFEGDTTKAVKAANTAILDMTDNAAKMGTPIENIQNAYQGFAKQNYTMLDNLKLGYGGTKTEMERLLADATELSGVEYDISNLGDVYEAIHVIQEDLGLTGVAADEAASTLSGSFGAMKAAAENLMANLALGENVGPAMNDLVQTAVAAAGNLIPAIGNILSGLPGAISTAVDALHPALMEGLTKATAAVKANFPQMLQGALEGLMHFSETIRANAGQLIDAGLTLIKSIADGIIKNIPVFIQTVPTIISNFAGVINDNAPKILEIGASIIKSLATGLIKAIPVLIANLPKILKAIWDVFTAFQWLILGKTVISAIGKGIKGAASGIGSAVKSIVNNIKSIFSSGFGQAKSNVLKLFDGIKTGMSNKMTAARDAVKKVIDKIKDIFPLSIGKIFTNLQLPHISVSGGSAPFGIGGKGSLPKFSVNWYAKAMKTPYVFQEATLFGAGEKGAEVLYGKKALMDDIREATSGGSNIYVTLNASTSESPEQFAQRFTRELKLQARMGAI